MNLMYAQFVGVGAILFSILSAQCRKKKNILLFLLISSVFYSITYFLLNASSAGLMHLLTIIFFAIYYLIVKKSDNINILFPTLFCLLTITCSVYFKFKPFDMIPVLICLVYIISSFYKGSIILKTMLMICSLIWIYYNFRVQAYICLTGNIVEIVLLYINLFRKK